MNMRGSRNSMLLLWCHTVNCQNYAKVMTTNSQVFNQLFHGLLDNGVYIAPALYEAGFVSAAHTDEDIAISIEVAKKVMAGL